MNQNSTAKLTCMATCWIVALLLGVLVAVILTLLANFALVAGIFLGLLVAGIAGAILSWAFCRDLPMPIGGVGQTQPGKMVSSPTGVGTGTPKAASAATAAPAAATTATGLMSDHAAAEDHSAPAETAPAEPAPAAKPAPAAAAAPAKKAAPAAKKPATKPKATKAAEAPASEGAAAGGQPELLNEPQGGKADDLKQIKGVGPGLEKTLNEMGIWHFSQVASWGAAEVEWVDSRLKFKGRIERDDWISQAKTLAGGGATDFSKRVDKGDVY